MPLPYDETDPLSIEAWGKRLVGKTLREMIPDGAKLATGGGKGSFANCLSLDTSASVLATSPS